jgi:hypothetical protein
VKDKEDEVQGRPIYEYVWEIVASKIINEILIISCLLEFKENC